MAAFQVLFGVRLIESLDLVFFLRLFQAPFLFILPRPLTPVLPKPRFFMTLAHLRIAHCTFAHYTQLLKF
jgi:hypothetical protein